MCTHILALMMIHGSPVCASLQPSNQHEVGKNQYFLTDPTLTLEVSGSLCNPKESWP